MIIYENERFYKIRQRASNLLRDLKIDTSSAIDILNIITSLDKTISLKIADLKGIPGFTCYDKRKDRYRIFTDENLMVHCPTRFKFTVAHELGHILLNHFSYTDSSLYMDYIMEREANVFVDELLMPTKCVLWHKYSAREVAEIYEVSALAAYNKIAHMKKNALYKELEGEIAAEFTAYRRIWYTPISDPRDKIVEQIRDAWLDPDYMVGGF